MDLRELCSMGGFFALRTGTPDGGTPLGRIYAGDYAPLTLRVDLVAARHSTPERRVAASIAQLGLAARLWSIALGAAALYGELPDLDPDRLHWAPDRSIPDDLCLSAPGAPPAAQARSSARALPATAATIREAVQYAHLAPLADALNRDTRISHRLLWGNAGSALAGAVRQIDDWARQGGADRGAVARRADALAAELLTHPDLSGTVRGPRMRRTSCCLYYRAPAGALCGDCVFDHPPGRPAR
ncbi:IucA/IucC family C-terminal-domain containing protein [Streptomyces sp. NPDC055078]